MGRRLEGHLGQLPKGQKMALLLMSWLLCVWASISFSTGLYGLTPFHLSDSYPRLGPAPVLPPAALLSTPFLLCSHHWLVSIPYPPPPPRQPGHPQFSVNIHVPRSVLAPNVDASSPWRVILEPETLAEAHSPCLVCVGGVCGGTRGRGVLEA